TTERLREQLGRLGGSPFTLRALTSRLEGDLILPVSELNRMRREIVAKLETQRAKPKVWTLRSEPGCPTLASLDRRTSKALSEPSSDPARIAELIVLVRNLAQLEA